MLISKRKERFDKCETLDDYTKLYIDIFKEEPAVNASNWGFPPIDDIIDSIITGKKIKKERKRKVRL